MNEIIMKPYSPFNGFINYFYKGADVFSFFKAEGEKYASQWGDASTVINYSITCIDTSCQWVSTNDQSKSFILFTFECPIFLTHYTLKTRTLGNENFPISWTVECSYDGVNWLTADTKTNREELIGNGAYHTFKCDKAFMYAKKIRIWCKGTTTPSIYYFHLSRVEFFGKMDIDQCKVPFSANNRHICRYINTQNLDQKNVMAI